MLLAPVEYARPESVDEALALLSSHEGAAVLAGGQSLVNVLKHRVADVDLLVDVSRLGELRRIDPTADGSLTIGACVTYDEIANSAAVKAAHPMLARVADHIEDQQIRNRGTIGGNCCLSDPTNNLPPLLVALDATMHILSSSGSRDVAADEFFEGYFATAVRDGELLRCITVPAVPRDAGIGYNTVAVGADSKAIARAAVRVRSNGTISEARVVLACASPAPLRHSATEEALRGLPATVDSALQAVQRIGDDLQPLSDCHGSAEYRREMARVVASRAICEAISTGGSDNG